MPLNPLEITGGLAIGEGVGGAIEATVEPRLQNFKNDQWAKHQDKPLDPADAAAAEQQGYGGNLVGLTDASFNGIDGDRYLALRYLAATAPGTPELLELWRRDKIGPDLVRAGLKKAGLMDEFVDAVLELFTGRLDPAIIATAIQRGIMKDPGFLPVGPPTATGQVPAFPVSPLDPIAEAKAHGIDEQRLFVETAIVGLPLSLQQAASAYFRGIIELPDFQRAVAEGNTRNEWGSAALDQARQILTASEYCELELRGFLTTAERHALTAKHGMSTADSDRLYDVLGRLPNVHQILIGERRGGVFNGPTTNIPTPYLRAMQRGNLRPESYNLAYAARETYPSYFVTRALLQAGAITPERGKQLFDGLGWPQDVADAAAAFFGGGTTSTTDPLVRSARTSLVTALRRAFVLGDEDETAARALLAAEAVPAATIDTLIATWTRERSITRKELTPTQLKKALGEGITNPTTGAPFTVDEVIAELVLRGYSSEDARVFIQM
jgi:hypothetical protein